MHLPWPAHRQNVIKRRRQPVVSAPRIIEQKVVRQNKRISRSVERACLLTFAIISGCLLTAPFILAIWSQELFAGWYIPTFLELLLNGFLAIFLTGAILFAGASLKNKTLAKTAIITVVLVVGSQLFWSVKLADLKREFRLKVESLAAQQQDRVTSDPTKKEIAEIIEKRDSLLRTCGFVAVWGWYYDPTTGNATVQCLYLPGWSVTNKKQEADGKAQN